MKITFNVFTIIIVFILLSSCTKTDHEVRFQNLYSKDFTHVVMGGNDYGTVKSGQTSAYMKVPEGSGTLSGISSDSTMKLTGSYSISGKGKHNWTNTLSAAGTLSFKEDK